MAHCAARDRVGRGVRAHRLSLLMSIKEAEPERNKQQNDAKGPEKRDSSETTRAINQHPTPQENTWKNRECRTYGPHVTIATERIDGCGPDEEADARQYRCKLLAHAN